MNKKTPNGADLLETLIKLLAEQEGVKITYEIIEEAKGAINTGAQMAV